jgi:hypothetical protein
MISGVNNLRDTFSIFHDGGISGFTSSGQDLILDVEIMYLAERINPSYRVFRLTLRNARDIVFETWPKDSNAEPSKISSLSKIFVPELEILGCEVAGDDLKVTCNQPSANCNYCGGTLFLKTDSASVTDESGKEYSIEELRQLSAGYWSDWEKKTANR